MSWNRALLMYEKSGHPEWSGVDSCKLFMSSLLPEFMASKVSIDEAKLDAAKEVHGDDYEAMLKEVMEDHGREYTTRTHTICSPYRLFCHFCPLGPVSEVDGWSAAASYYAVGDMELIVDSIFPPDISELTFRQATKKYPF